MDVICYPDEYSGGYGVQIYSFKCVAATTVVMTTLMRKQVFKGIVRSEKLLIAIETF
ncbi:hypothetical protein V7O67_13570 [Methanolobus sp. ZRKC4]|uniref:hypothetical protein n=1 Tax=Methanolobus sp. ZRKC4 TaxID=3125787 RepID=UPI003245EA94